MSLFFTYSKVRSNQCWSSLLISSPYFFNSSVTLSIIWYALCVSRQHFCCLVSTDFLWSRQININEWSICRKIKKWCKYKKEGEKISKWGKWKFVTYIKFLKVLDRLLEGFLYKWISYEWVSYKKNVCIVFVFCFAKTKSWNRWRIINRTYFWVWKAT